MSMRRLLRNILETLHLLTFAKIIVRKYRRFIVARHYCKLERIYNEIKNKNTFKVAFVLQNPGFWKNEALWRAMEKHGRFELTYWIAPYYSTDNKERLIDECVDFARRKSRCYFVASSLSELRKSYAPDYIFIMQPHRYIVPFSLKELKKELVCYVPYCYCNTNDSAGFACEIQHYLWRFYVDSDYTKELALKYLHSKGKNLRVSGFPMADELLNNSYQSVWPEKSNGKKKIIWAPHWSIRAWSGGLFDVSSFLYVAEDMLKLAAKYRDSVHFAFKPHPILEYVLNHDPEWGRERTAKYFKAWSEGENSSLVEGAYSSLFKQSDAMIHDSGSFILEYLLVDKPCMYLCYAANKADFNLQTSRAIECYEKGSCVEDIDKFIQNVLLGEDPKLSQRREFICSYMIPPGGSASQNIISDLLGL